MRAWVAFSLVVAASWPSVASAQDVGLAILDEAAERYQGVETLCAHFSQHLAVPLLGDERTGSGRVCQRAPNLFAMRFTEPEGDLVVIDGASVWVYLPSNDPRQVLRSPAGANAGGHDFYREFLDRPQERYEIAYEGRDDVAGTPTHRLRMTPLGRAGYQSAVVWIDRGEPVLRQVRVEEVNGNVRTITLSAVEFGGQAGADFFRFTPPEGALVIEG